MRNLAQAALVLIMLNICFPVLAINGETIVFNPTTGNYLITHYSNIDQKFEQLIFIPATKINPTINTKVKLVQDGIVQYEYSLISGRDSQQDIVLFILNPVSSVTTSLPNIPLNAPAGRVAIDMLNVANYFNTPPLWDPSLSYSDNRTSFIIGWSYARETSGLKPGNKAAFGFKSRDLPGIINAKIHGDAPLASQQIDAEELPDEEDNGFGQQYFALLRNNFIRRPAAVPTITVPTPFNAATLLDRIQTQTHTWIAMQLLDATFSSQLDRYLTAAADAYRLNQPKAGKEHIETLRKMLKREHDDLGRDEEHESENNRENDEGHKSKMISRLAARVLDFDLKYVLKRMGGDKDD